MNRSSQDRRGEAAGGTGSIDRQALHDWSRLLHLPGDVFSVETRVGRRTWNGCYHYNDIDRLVDDLDRLNGSAKGALTSVSVNPVSPTHLTNGALVEANSDPRPLDVLERRWMPVLVTGDPGAALDLATRMVTTLGAEGWPQPVVLQSPDAAILLFRARLRADDDDHALIETAQTNLAARFLAQGVKVSAAGARVDLHVGVPGLGEGHHHWRLITAPGRLDVVTREVLRNGRTPEVLTSASDESFESGLEELERVLEDATLGPQPIEDLSAPVSRPMVPVTRALPMPAPLAVRPPAREVRPRLPATRFEDVLDRYRAQHRHQGLRIATTLPEIDQAIGGLRGVVTIVGEPGTGRSTLALQMASAILLGDDGGQAAVVIAAWGTPRQDVTDRLLSHVAQLPVDTLNHGDATRRVSPSDGLRLGTAERRRLKVAIAKLEGAQERLFLLDPEWLERQPHGLRPRDWLSAAITDARRGSGARRCVCVIDDWSEWARLIEQGEPDLELRRLALDHADDVLVVVAAPGDVAALGVVNVRLQLERREAPTVPGVEALRVSASSRRSVEPDASVDVRFHYREHRFTSES
jgi:hypothetical protein